MVIVICVIVFFIITIMAFLIVGASIDYKKMSYSEQLKSQIEKEEQVYSNTIFEKIEVIRSWYNFDPTTWNYLVTFKDSDEVRLYKYFNGIFIQIKKESS